MSEAKKNNSTIYLIVIALLVVVIAYLLYNQNKQTQTIEQQEDTIAVQDADITRKAQELDELRLEYARVMEERTLLGLSNDSLNEQVSKLDQTIRELRRTGSINAQKRKELEDLVVSLRSDIAQKDAEIAVLKQQVDSLGQANQSLQSENQEMGSEIQTLKTTEQRLSEKVAIASRLKVENLKMFAINAKGKERDGNEHRSKNIEKIKLLFNLGQNDVAEKNTKEVYLKVTDPSGTVLYDLSSGGGIFNFNGEKSFYTSRNEIAFDNSNQQVEFIYTKGIPFIQGNHLFELFCEGYKIGESTLIVK